MNVQFGARSFLKYKKNIVSGGRLKYLCALYVQMICKISAMGHNKQIQ